MQNQWSEKLPDFVKRLEAALFNQAQTKASTVHQSARPAEREFRAHYSLVYLQEDYSNFDTLESRLQEVARRLVHRPQAGTPSTASSCPGPSSNGAFNSQSVQQGVQQQQQTMQMMLPGAGFGGSQAMQPTMGMIPTPNAGITNSTGMVPIKTDPCGPPSNPPMLPNGMVPVVDGTGTAGLGNNGYQQPSGMIPVPGMMGHNAMSVMSNGAPVLIKQDNWSAPAHSPNMIPVGPLLPGQQQSHVFCPSTLLTDCVLPL